MLINNIKLILITVITTVILVIISLFLLKNSSNAPEVKLDLSRASVIKEIQALNKLETASFTIEKIIEAGQKGNVFQDLIYGDRILLVAHGKVIAGIDIAQVKENDILVDGSSLSITLPAPIIFSSTLDNSNTTVYDRTQGYLSRGNKDLESKARQAAEVSIRDAACDAGILEEARTNAIQRIKQLFQFAGFTKIEVIIPQSKC